MNVKQFDSTLDIDPIEIRLAVDMDVLTPAVAQEINSFWGGDDDRIREAGGDVVLAVVRMAARRLTFKLLADSYFDNDAPFRDTEGWPEDPGIKVVSDSGSADFPNTDLRITPVE